MKAPADPDARGMLSKIKVVNDEKWISLTPMRNSSSVKGMGWANAYTLKPKQTNQYQAQQINFSVHYPTAICPSSTVPFVLWAETPQFEGRPSKTIQAAVIDLTVSIVGKTSVRDDSQAATEHTAVKFEKEALCWRRDQQNIDLRLKHNSETGKLSDKLDLEDLIHTPALIPSFSTYNIARQYFLEYELKIRVFGETNTMITLKESDLAVVVFPAGSDAVAREWSQTIVPKTPP